MTIMIDKPASSVKLVLEELGKRLLQRDSSGGRLLWPDERTQLNYTGASNEVLMRRTIDFVELMHAQLPCLASGRWRGLDYGVGWGRIASLMSAFGDASQLDCADAWPKSLTLARECGLMNKMIHTSPALAQDSLASDAYDFVYSYSILTHLPAAHIINNMSHLVESLKVGGKVVFTLREERFLGFLERSGKLRAVDDRIADEGYWFGNAQSDDYGDTVVTEKWVDKHLGHLGELRTLGVIASEPFQVIWTLTKCA